MHHRSFKFRRCFCLVIFYGVTLFPGCGSSGPEVVKINGRVLLDGQPPPSGGNVVFAPVKAEEGLPLRPAVASFGTDGWFSVTSFEPGDGIVPGTYRVTIECSFVPPKSFYDPGKSAIPAGYVPPDLVVKKGTPGPIDVVYDVPTKKN